MNKRARNTLVQSTLNLGAALFSVFIVTACAAVPPPAGVECSAHPVCAVDGPGCSAGLDCISIPGCTSAICIPAAQACLESCGTPNCEILESYPEQISCSGEPPAPGRPGAVSCEGLEAQRSAELSSIQSCNTDSDCGQVLRTSCGCTRNLVARTDADTTRFYAIEEELDALGCDRLVTTCDCPPADGFRCVSGSCSWNYTN